MAMLTLARDSVCTETVLKDNTKSYSIMLLASSDARPKRSRWGPPGKRTIIPNVACILPPDLPPDILHAFLLRFQFEEVEYKLSHLESEQKNVNFAENPLAESRFSPSPDVRARNSLVQERRQVMTSIDRIYPIFQPPLPLRLSLTKSVKKLILPSEKAIGAVVGARGTTVKMLEKEFGVKISLRGSSAAYELDEQPHVLIIGNKDDDVDRCHRKLTGMLEITEAEAEAAPDDHLMLRFDPKDDILPWGGPSAAADELSDGQVDHAMQELMRELAQGGRAAADEETPARRQLFRTCEFDLGFRDISVILKEPPPPGLTD
jgi:hypothetical protein